MKYKTFRHLVCQKHFLERPKCSCIRLCMCREVVGGGVSKNTSPDRQVILYLSVRGPVKPSWEASGALWDKAAAVPGPWSKPAEQVLCYLKRWRTLLHMNSALPD